MTDAPTAGTIADLVDFLERATREEDLHPSTVQAMRSAWRSVTQELDISPARGVRDLSPDELVDAFERRRGPNFRSGATYRTRLRVGQQLYLAWLAGDPDWTEVARRRTPGGVRSINRSTTGRATVRVVQFPLRRDMMLDVEVPYDLTAQEAERLCGFLKSFVIPEDEPPPA
jgi:hypothetical protein